MTMRYILGSFKEATRKRFLAYLSQGVDIPQGLAVPNDPHEALRLGYMLGRKEGYGNGLVEGTELGLDVGLEAMDVLTSQPVVFGEPGVA